jgi:hypothetical protein
MTSELSDEDKWPLPDYHPEPTPKQLHALGVLSLNFVKLQGNMDELYFLKAVAGAEFELTKRIDRLSTRQGYMRLTLRQVRAVAEGKASSSARKSRCFFATPAG